MSDNNKEEKKKKKEISIISIDNLYFFAVKKYRFNFQGLMYVCLVFLKCR